MDEGCRAPFSRYVLLVGAVVFAVLMALSGRYGFQRDELYMLQCGQHLQASYVDQPVLAPLLARASFAMFGLSTTALRWWAALAAWVTVVVGGLTAREFGGGRRTQLLTAIGVGTMPVLLGSDHVANTSALMLLGEASLGLVVARLGRTGDTRWWLAAGAVAGVGAEDNHLVGVLAIALVAGALISGVRPDRWLAGGAAIAVVLLIPDIWWQATHGWATLAMTHALNSRNGGVAGIVTWIPGQLGMTALGLAWVWVIGLRFLWRSGHPAWRAVVWAYGLLFVVFMLTTGKQFYYLGGVYVTLLAGGMVSVDGWLRENPVRLRRTLGATAITALVGAMVTLPVLPPKIGGKLNSDNAESIGWPQLVSTVRAAWLSLPAGTRANAVIFTANYSEAAAINELGHGLPTAVSGHNTYWWWGPGNPRATTMLMVAQGGVSAAQVSPYCSSVRTMATLTNPYGIKNIEDGGHVYLCSGLHEPLGQLWPRLRHYN
ncbi:MAG: glycosyltransferase family 39 protein [Streptosporangiaceae bacterium]